MTVTIGRRELLAALGGAAAAWPLAGRAQQRDRVYRIGFLANDPTIPTTPPGQAFLDGLRESGFVEGQNITIERRFARGRVGVGPELAAELVRLDLDLVVASGDQNVVALKRATSKIPIVMVNAIDPVGAGLVASLARPGGNITGLVQVPSAELTSKRMQLFKDAVPHISRVAVLMNPDIGVDNSQLRDLERAAQSLGIALIPVRVRQGSELIDALAGTIREHADALFGMNDGLNLTHRSAIIDFSTRNRMPSMHAFAELAQEGGLMAYATSRPDLFRRSGVYAGKILKGARPADLPIEQPVKFELIVNLKAANALGLTIRRDFLLLADQVIE
jgi:putative ABC transport system substrate-binding protein